MMKNNQSQDSRSLLSLLLTGMSTAGSDLIERTGKITGISYCRPLEPHDFNDLRDALAKASNSLAAYDAAVSSGASHMTCDAFFELRAKMGGQAEAIYAAYLGILVLRTMCKAAGLELAEQRARELVIELDTVFPGLSGRAALRDAAAGRGTEAEARPNG